jgi:hypothetical protein
VPPRQPGGGSRGLRRPGEEDHAGHSSRRGINYWDAVAESPSQLEICFAIFANVLELDDQGDPVNEKHAERRAPRWPDPGTALAQIAPEGSIELAARGMVKGAGHAALDRCRGRHAVSRAQLVHALGVRRVGERRLRCAG